MRIARLTRQVLFAATIAAVQTGAIGQTLAPVDPFIHRSNFVVADMDRAMQLYRDILGLKVNVMMPVKPDSYMYDVLNIDRSARLRIAFLSSPDNRFGALGLTEVKGIDLPPKPALYPSVLVVEIKGRMESVYDKVRAAKPELQVGKIYELQNPSRRELLLTDYDGNRIIIMQYHSSDAANADHP